MVVNCKVSYDLLCAMDIMTEELFLLPLLWFSGATLKVIFAKS